MANIEDIEGIGPKYGQKLKDFGLNTIEKLLEKGSTAKGRQEIANATGISEKLILTWTNMADLCRIKGVGPEFAELLEAAGVDTVKELRHRRADNLHAKMLEVNAEKKLTRVVPNQEQIAGFIEQAKNLEPIMTY